MLSCSFHRPKQEQNPSVFNTVLLSSISIISQ